jgi:RNA polymerase sigma-70 factor (ECF subfamily)
MTVSQPDQGAQTIEELFLALESPLLRYARSLAATQEMAEDLVQEAFMRLQTQFSQVRSPSSWLYRTVHNLALNQRRSDQRVVPLDPAPDQATSANSDLWDVLPLPDEQIASREAATLLRFNLKNLDACSQEIIRLKFTENLSYKEISGRTGLTVGNVGYLLHHAIKSLAADLTKAGLLP